MDVRWPETEVRERAPADATLAFDGVPVREAAALDAALKGFVGDFVGDCVNVSTLHLHGAQMHIPQSQEVSLC